MEGALYLQQQQREQDFQRDLRLRQLLLQEQYGQHPNFGSMLQEQQLRSLGEQLHEYPDVQQHYHNLLLREHLQRHEESSIIEQLRYQEELRRQQQLQVHQQETLPLQAYSQDFAQAQARAHAEAQAQEIAQGHSLSKSEIPTSQSQEQGQAAPDVARLRDLAADSLAGNAVKKSGLEHKKKGKDDEGKSVDESEPPSATRSAKEPKEKAKKPKAKPGRKPKAKNAQTPGIQFVQASSSVPPQAPAMNPKRLKSAAANKSSLAQTSDFTGHFPEHGDPEGTWKRQATSRKAPSMAMLEHVAEQSELLPVSVPRLGTVQGLLEAAEDKHSVDDAVGALQAFKGVTSSELQEEPDHPKINVEHGVSVRLPNGFSSALPQLPEEPLWEETPLGAEKEDISHSIYDGTEDGGVDDGKTNVPMDVDETTSAKKRTISNILDYPYPIDVWWPSNQAIRRERKAAGDVSDEDDFPDEPSWTQEKPRFRANLPKIKARLSQELRPGVLEKMPHCRLHRVLMKKKKNLSAPELVYCWQVTDIYPNEMMVCCSVCGTWRHAACGGHYKPYSVREHTQQPFVPVCDFCHEEEKILRDYPIAKKRIDKQRMEQLRRGLTTSAVMRHATFSKHGGTYKWPIGRVPTAQMGGHIRSVHSRQDKAEKQWSDMVARLTRTFNRPRERARVRTKELERLLVSVEDAEAYTDRHNILLFLMRDTMKEHPVGFENERKNIFDPAEDEESLLATLESSQDEEGLKENDKTEDAKSTLDVDTAKEEEESTTKIVNHCARDGCTKKPRFDSIFCSDSCGVSALESDLLRSVQESNDMHPSILRN